MKSITPAELAKIAAPWIKVLGLEHWDIEWRYGGCGGDASARANIEAGLHRAIIRVYEDWDQGADNALHNTLECLILHELLHCCLQIIDDLVLSDSPALTEYLCWMIARLLLECKKWGLFGGWAAVEADK